MKEEERAELFLPEIRCRSGDTLKRMPTLLFCALPYRPGPSQKNFWEKDHGESLH